MNRLDSFLEKMEKDIPRMLLKDKRLSKTMRERVSSMEGYYGAKRLIFSVLLSLMPMPHSRLAC